MDYIELWIQEEEHNSQLREKLAWLGSAGITLNQEKCKLSKLRIKFLSQIISENGMQANPEKIKAILEHSPPNTKEPQRFFGIVNYLGKFSPSLANSASSLRQLLLKENEWVWGTNQVKEFEELKLKLASTPVLQAFRFRAETMISRDASLSGLGAAVLQNLMTTHGDQLHGPQGAPQYAQIEKEALAICWGCEKFN